MGDPQHASPVDPRDRHERQGLDGPDDLAPAGAPTASRSAPTPARTSSASTSGSPATASRSPTRSSPSRSPAIADLELHRRPAAELLRDPHRGGVPLVRRRRRRRDGDRGRAARPLGRDQRRRPPTSPSSPTSGWTTPSSPARRSADIAREKAGIIKPTSAAIIGETDPDLVDIFRGRRRGDHVRPRPGLRDDEQPPRGRRPPARPAHADDDLPRRLPAAARRPPGRQRDPRADRRRDVLRRAARRSRW